MPPTKEKDDQSIVDLVDKYINENDVMIFSKSWCPYCRKVRSFSENKHRIHSFFSFFFVQIKDALNSAEIEFYSIEIDKIRETFFI